MLTDAGHPAHHERNGVTGQNRTLAPEARTCGKICLFCEHGDDQWFMAFTLPRQ
jgi:hypothetical protein